MRDSVQRRRVRRHGPVCRDEHAGRSRVASRDRAEQCDGGGPSHLEGPHAAATPPIRAVTHEVPGGTFGAVDRSDPAKGRHQGDLLALGGGRAEVHRRPQPAWAQGREAVRGTPALQPPEEAVQPVGQGRGFVRYVEHGREAHVQVLGPPQRQAAVAGPLSPRRGRQRPRGESLGDCPHVVQDRGVVRVATSQRARRPSRTRLASAPFMASSTLEPRG